MQTKITAEFTATAAGREAESILRSCVHCGFCTATCPTYQLLGDELDSPRGRIYLIKQILEGNAVSRQTQIHLDRCLTCRSCETTCPSGVRYGRLVDIGRHLLESRVRRGAGQRAMRALLRLIVTDTRIFSRLLRLARAVSALLPARLAKKLPPQPVTAVWPEASHPRKMLALDGCVQSVCTPLTNAAAATVLDRLGIQLLAGAHAGCCGAVDYHLAAQDTALQRMRRNIDAWWPQVEQGIEAIVVNASGCAVMVKEYGMLLAGDEEYAHKAQAISALCRDLSEVLAAENLAPLAGAGGGRRVAFHAPCSLQHGQKINGVVENILRQSGFTLTAIKDPHLCCGSAGTYSLLQPQLSQRLLVNKLQALQADAPQVIATANIGCQLHLASRAGVPVCHWIELLAV